MRQAYSVYFANGQFFQTCITTADEMASFPLDEGQGFIEGGYPGDKYYFDGEAAVKFPEKPDASSVWDWDAKVWTLSLSDVKATALVTLTNKYTSLEAGKDPETGDSVYVDCTSGDYSIRLDCKKDAAETFESGISLATNQGEETTPIVDFYDNVHTDVPLADAEVMNGQQGVAWRNIYLQKQALRTAINAINVDDYDTEDEAIAALQAIDITFTVNAE